MFMCLTLLFINKVCDLKYTVICVMLHEHVKVVQSISISGIEIITAQNPVYIKMFTSQIYNYLLYTFTTYITFSLYLI